MPNSSSVECSSESDPLLLVFFSTSPACGEDFVSPGFAPRFCLRGDVDRTGLRRDVDGTGSERDVDGTGSQRDVDGPGSRRDVDGAGSRRDVDGAGSRGDLEGRNVEDLRFRPDVDGTGLCFTFEGLASCCDVEGARTVSRPRALVEVEGLDDVDVGFFLESLRDKDFFLLPPIGPPPEGLMFLSLARCISRLTSASSSSSVLFLRDPRIGRGSSVSMTPRPASG